jgi:hypothetical protein
VNLSALDPLADRLTEELQFYTDLRQLLGRGQAIGTELPEGL